VASIAKLTTCVRNASSLLQKMVEEAEAEETQPELPLCPEPGLEPLTMGGIDREITPLWKGRDDV
jgi:hypothetical protein